MNINRDYLIINDVKKSNVQLSNNNIFFYITDKNTQNIFVNLVINVSDSNLITKYANIENAEDYTLTMNIVKPDNTSKIIDAKLHSKEEAIFEFDLPEECCDVVGTYKCELLTKCVIDGHDEITTSNKLTYKVKSSVLNDLDNIVNAPEYPLVIQLFDKLSDIEQYEEDRRANELARQLAEQQRQQRFNELDTNIEDKITSMDDKMEDVEHRVQTKEQAVDKLIVDTKKDIDDYKVAKDTEINEYKTAKDQQINQAITNQNNKIDDAIANQNNKIDTAIAEQNNRIETVEASDNTQNTRLDALEAKDIAQETSITNIEAKNVEQDNRLDAIEIKNQQQDDRLLDVEKVNKRQDMDLKCLFAESKNNMIDVTEEGNSIYLQNSTAGYTLIDEIQGNTMVNCNKEPDKEITLNGNINTQGYSNVTLTEGVDGGLVDVALEGNTMVNVCDQKDPVAITKSYTVETGNHVALQGEYDGKCRPVVTGNTLVNLVEFSNKNSSTNPPYVKLNQVQTLKTNTTYTFITPLFDSSKILMFVGYDGSNTLVAYQTNNIVSFTTGNTIPYDTIYLYYNKRSNAEGTPSVDFVNNIDGTGYILLEGDYTNKPIPGCFEGLQSSFEDKVVTQEMVDAGEELAENLGKYRVDYVISKEDGTVGFTKTFYLNSPLLEGDTIEQQGNNVVHVHRSELRAYQTGDELTLPTDKTNTLVAKATPQYEVISTNDAILCDSYVNGHLDVDSVVPIERVKFNWTEIPIRYIYGNITYTIQFEADNIGKLTWIQLGGLNAKYDIDIIKGVNKITYKKTNPGIKSLLVNGIGFNASNIVVTPAIEQNFGYFKGMKSVGECEDLEVVSSNSDSTLSNTQTLTHEPLRAVEDIKDKYVLIDGKWYIERNCGVRAYQEGDIDNYITDMINTVYPLSTPYYEPIDYNPFTVYSDITHISNNSTIPCNMTIKNTGYNCLLKPSTTYTVSSNLGLNTVTTPTTLTEDCLRFYDTDTSTVTTMKDVTILEGDYTTGKPLPSHFSGLESAFEQEYDEEKGKYKVKVKVVGKNLLDVSNCEFISIDGSNVSPPIVQGSEIHLSNIRNNEQGYKVRVKPNTEYTSYVKASNGEFRHSIYDIYGNKLSTGDNFSSTSYVSQKTFNSGNNNYIIFKLSKHTADNIIITQCQLEQGTEATPYEPYKESVIEFYIDEPLRGIGDVKDKVYVKNDKVVVERKCGQRAYQDGDFGTHLTDKVNTVYQLVEPTYEEVEYNDVKLFIESFKNSTLFYNSNVPVTSKLYYSYSVPLVDTVAQTASISDEQDLLLVNMATEIAIMQLTL